MDSSSSMIAIVGAVVKHCPQLKNWTIPDRYPTLVAPAEYHTLVASVLLGCSFDSQQFGHCHQIGDRPRLHLFHCSSPMNLHSDLFDLKLICDLFVSQAGSSECHYFLLAHGQRRKALP